jgi:hypothetical protein
MPPSLLKIRTTVRFFVLTAGLTGCSVGPRLAPTALVCDERLPALCSTFAKQAQCTCAARADLERLLGGLGAAAWPGSID